MNIGLLVWTLIVGLVCGHLLYYVTWFHIEYYLIRIYHGYSFRRFSSFYEKSQNNFKGYDFYFKPVMTNSQYLQAFEGYDVDSAYTEYRQSVKRTAKNLFRRQLPTKLIVLLIGYSIFPRPLLGLAVIVGYFTIRISRRALNGTLIFTATAMLSLKLAKAACLHAYGQKRTDALLTPKPDSDPILGTIDTTKFDRALFFVERIVLNNRWIIIAVVWLCLWKPLGAIPFDLNSKIDVNIMSMVGAIFGTFPIIYFVVWALVRMGVNEEQKRNRLAEDTEV